VRSNSIVDEDFDADDAAFQELLAASGERGAFDRYSITFMLLLPFCTAMPSLLACKDRLGHMLTVFVWGK
jgi:hypothetical protein